MLIPVWQLNGTPETIEAMIGRGFRFQGEGWYAGNGYNVLIMPLPLFPLLYRACYFDLRIPIEHGALNYPITENDV